ncbi:MAG: hypothetical protein AB7N91_20505 [Candidatus Tectimicrobiota bacterium]
METVVYRKTRISVPPQADQDGMWPESLPTDRSASPWRTTGPLTADLFYPVVTGQEMVTWSHWLPTCLHFARSESHLSAELTHTLQQLQAPAEVWEELRWACQLALFESYEIRTPVRNDQRDPLILGCVGQQRYRLALWGESLLPLEQIQTLVQRSLDLRARARRYQACAAPLGGLIGLAIGWPLIALSPAPQVLPMSLFFASLGACLAWLPTFVYTPENRQHDFLDHYRR